MPDTTHPYLLPACDRRHLHDLAQILHRLVNTDFCDPRTRDSTIRALQVWEPILHDLAEARIVFTALLPSRC